MTNSSQGSYFGGTSGNSSGVGGSHAGPGAGKGSPQARARAMRVSDVQGHEHVLVSEIGRGGQGRVYQTENLEIAVKLLCDRDGKPLSDDGSDAGVQRSIEDVLTLPLEGLPIALPIAPLETPSVGYAMRMLKGVVPISTLWRVPASEGVAAFYIRTGGLRRRLLLLGRLAETMARLHALPAVYSDLSPNNALISESTDHARIWLIDADNLHVIGGERKFVHTPGFGAPEVVRGEQHVSTLSDCYSFAVLAHMVLRLTHPYLGQRLQDADWAASVDMEREAHEGRLPWVDHPTDASNRQVVGLPSEVLGSGRLNALFHRAFVEGRDDPAVRPSMAEWAQLLYFAHDMTAVCPSCGGTSFWKSGAKCSFCPVAGGGVAIIDSRVWVPECDQGLDDLTYGRKAAAATDEFKRELDPDREPDTPGKPVMSTVVWRKVVSAGESAEVPEACVKPAELVNLRNPAFVVHVGKNTLVIEWSPATIGKYMIVGTDGKSSSISSARTELPLSKKSSYLAYVHCGPLTEAHRLLSIAYFPGAVHGVG